ncbi:MAG: hypothetical protein GY778_14380 [bacterium]|nr:hypothetical protein [bacterium]
MRTPAINSERRLPIGSGWGPACDPTVPRAGAVNANEAIYRPVVFVAAIAMLLGLALLFATGVVASDDTYYLDVARTWQPGGDRTAAENVYARLAMWYPIRVATWVVGDTWRALLWPPLISAGVALAAVAVLGRRWFGPRAGLFAVAALGLTTHFLVAATIALPDIVAAAAVAVAVVLTGPSLLDRDCRRATRLALLGGLVIGLGYSAKEIVALVAPALGMFVLLRRFRCVWAWKRLAAVAAGAMVWLVVEGVVLWRYTGDPLFHYHAVRDSQAGYGSALANPTWFALLDYWTQYVRWLMDPGYNSRWWGPVYLGGMTLALIRSNDRTRLLLCIICVLGLYLSVGSSDLAHYAPLWHQPRYLIPLFPPAALLVGYAADWLLRRRRLIARATATAMACLAVASLYWANQDAGQWYAAREFAAGRAFFDEYDPPAVSVGRLCASGHTAYRLHLLAGEAGLGEIEGIGRPPASPGDWVERYPGRYVLVAGPDRRPPPPGQRMTLLTAESVTALSGFERLAAVAPPRSRLDLLRSGLGLGESTTDPAERIELYRIPEAPLVIRND